MISVVVPARDAAATLGRTLSALAAQSDTECELIVVDDGSRDATARIAADAGVRVVHRPRPGGPAVARDAGVAAAAGDLIAFTDADCEPVPGWLAAARAALAAPARAGRAALAQGPIVPPPGAVIGRWDRYLDVRRPSPLFEAANLVVTRTAFERAGGFAPAGSRPPRGLHPRAGHEHFGEDARFGWRARRAGVVTVWAPEAVVHHAVFARDWTGWVSERARERFFPALVAEAPELRDHLPGRFFLSARSACFDLAAAGAVAAVTRREPRLLAATLPYLTRSRRDLHRPDAWREIAGRWVGDSVGCAALAGGSLAARRLLV